MFRRAITVMVERLKTTNEGRQCPQIADILERVDRELAEMKKRLDKMEKGA